MRKGGCGSPFDVQELFFLSPRWGTRKLTGRKQFQDVLARGRVITGRYFIIRARSREQNYARLGIVTARKLIRRAVDRNACKRLVREAFREHEVELAGLDIVVVCRMPISSRTRRPARQELGSLFPALHNGS